jgi:hypothetical protein
MIRLRVVKCTNAQYAVQVYWRDPLRGDAR